MNKLPHNFEAELSILGAMIINNEIIQDVKSVLNSYDFYAKQNEIIFNAIKNLDDINSPIDIYTLAEELKKNNYFEKIGGYDYLTKILDNVIAVTSINSYTEMIKKKSIRRKLIKGLGDVVSLSYEESNDTEEVMEIAQKLIFDIAMDKGAKDFVDIKQALDETIAHLSEIYKLGGDITGISTGYPNLDNYTSGLQKGNLILIAARPSMGKTALGLNIAQNVSIRGDKVVALFSLEMATNDLAKRLISAEAEVDSAKLNLGRQTMAEWKDIIATFNDIKNSKANLYIDDTSVISSAKIKNKCRKLKASKGLDLIIVDYLQLMSSNKKSENRLQEISAISRELKAISKELDCPVIALSQLSRASESRSDKRPMLSDLRESGAIEQDADMVMLLYRESYYNKDLDDNTTEVIVAKNRNGRTGTSILNYNAKFTKFEEIKKNYE